MPRLYLQHHEAILSASALENRSRIVTAGIDHWWDHLIQYLSLYLSSIARVYHKFPKCYRFSFFPISLLSLKCFSVFKHESLELGGFIGKAFFRERPQQNNQLRQHETKKQRRFCSLRARPRSIDLGHEARVAGAWSVSKMDFPAILLDRTVIGFVLFSL